MTDALLHELVRWYDIGEVLLRRGAVSPERLAEARGQVASGAVSGLFEALDVPGVDEGELHRAHQMGVEDVSIVFMLLKTGALSGEQLRTALDAAIQSDERLPEVLQRLGMWDETQVAYAISRLRGESEA